MPESFKSYRPMGALSSLVDWLWRQFRHGLLDLSMNWLRRESVVFLRYTLSGFISFYFVFGGQFLGRAQTLGVPSRGGLPALNGKLPEWWPQTPFAVTLRSRTGQFQVRGPSVPTASSSSLALSRRLSPRAPTLWQIPSSGTSDRVELDPASVAIACERIRVSIDRLLGLNGTHSAHILINITPEVSKTAQLRIESTPFSDCWQFSISLPLSIEWQRLIRAIVEVVLLDAINQGASTAVLRSVPLWLSEGTTFLLISGSGRELAPESNREFKESQRLIDPTALIMKRLEGRLPLDLSGLSFPSDEQLGSAASLALYQASAALFLQELMKVDSNRGTLRSFVMSLRRHLNWQTAFLEVWKGRFQSLLEVEKWWAVQATGKMLRNPSRLWSRDATVVELTGILTETASGVIGTNLGPVRIQKMSEVVVAWPYADQVVILDRKLQQLQTLFLFADADLVDLVRQAFGILDRYRFSRGNGGGAVRRGEVDPRGFLLANSTARQLASLETALSSMR